MTKYLLKARSTLSTLSLMLILGACNLGGSLGGTTAADTGTGTGTGSGSGASWSCNVSADDVCYKFTATTAATCTTGSAIASCALTCVATCSFAFAGGATTKMYFYSPTYAADTVQTYFCATTSSATATYSATCN